MVLISCAPVFAWYETFQQYSPTRLFPVSISYLEILTYSLSLFLLCNINMTARIIFGLRNQILCFWRYMYNYSSDKSCILLEISTISCAMSSRVVHRIVSCHRLSALCIYTLLAYKVGSQHNKYQCIFFYSFKLSFIFMIHLKIISSLYINQINL